MIWVRLAFAPDWSLLVSSIPVAVARCESNFGKQTCDAKDEQHYHRKYSAFGKIR